jgi:hypothetical protein
VQSRNRTVWIAAVLILLACLCACLIAVAGLAIYSVSDGGLLQPTPEVATAGPGTSAPGTIDPGATETPLSVERTPVGASGDETVERLLNSDIPENDPRALAERLKGIEDIPIVVRDTPPEYAIGDEEVFWASNTDNDEQFQVTAVLRAATDHVYMWVEKGERVDQRELEAAAETFETVTYLRNREFFGSEWIPGIDSDPHLYVLHARNLGQSTGGYYSSVDEYSRLVNEHSNEHEMFYVNLDASCDDCVSPVNSSYYNGTLAHEFQHMIHWNNDRNEESWMNEGSSVLAEFLNDFDTGSLDEYFMRRPDTQLTGWEEGGAGSNTEHYGAGFLFMLYFLDRFGEDATRALVAHAENGTTAVAAVLAEQEGGLTFDQVFGDWVAANYLDDNDVGAGVYGYNNFDPPRVRLEQRYDSFELAGGVGPLRTSVTQYGSDYLQLRGDQPVTFQFAGSTAVKLVDTDPHSGRYVWWGNRADESDTTLTRRIDLSGVSDVTLSYWTWYDLEEDWDYAYVMVSTNDGATWDILRTPDSTDTNPNGNSFGWAYTGRSGGGETAEWIEQSLDLSAYAGQANVLVRFEAITDQAVNRPGFVLDDIRIDAIGFSDDAEGDGDWEALGFVRHNNTLPQRFLVQVIERDATGAYSVRRLELADDQSGEWLIDLGGQVEEAIITISGLTPFTTEVATYEYTLQP